ncbi:MAG: LysR family transcriptional regulator [Nitrospirota bacterium]|nr:MAG: LysR family transcriptional regulator [Nitrospirota bacterium]
MDIHHLKIFVSVYKNRSFSKASSESRISQPTVSEHIKNLEKELDCKLFDRLGRSIIPTREANKLYPGALHIIDKLEELREDISASGSSIKGSLTIGASNIPGTYIIPPIAADFKKLHQDVSFEIMIEDSGRITERVLDHDLQLGVVGAVMEPGKLDYIKAFEDELILVSSPSSAKKTSIDTKGLAGLPFIIREDGSGTRKTMLEILRKKGIDLKNMNIIATLGSNDAIKQALKAGLGVSVLSRIAVDEDIKRGALNEIKVKGLKMARHFYIIKHKRRTLPANYASFMDFMMTEG